MPARRPLALLLVLSLLAFVASDDTIDTGVKSEASIDLSAYLTEADALQALRQVLCQNPSLARAVGRGQYAHLFDLCRWFRMDSVLTRHQAGSSLIVP